MVQQAFTGRRQVNSAGMAVWQQQGAQGGLQIALKRLLTAEAA